MNNGTTSYYLVKANNVVKDVTNDEDDFIQLMIPALNNGQITYVSDDANATPITDLRLPNVTSITGVEIHE